MKKQIPPSPREEIVKKKKQVFHKDRLWLALKIIAPALLNWQQATKNENVYNKILLWQIVAVRNFLNRYSLLDKNCQLCFLSRRTLIWLLVWKGSQTIVEGTESEDSLISVQG